MARSHVNEKPPKILEPGTTIPVNFVGHDRENLIFVAIVYWIFTFTLSRRSMKVEKKLGLGER